MQLNQPDSPERLRAPPSAYAARDQDSEDYARPHIETMCRIRPTEVGKESDDIVVDLDKPSITLKYTEKNRQKEFPFQRIFREGLSQDEVCNELMNKILRAQSELSKGSLILSYGVTNSGKTFTTLGTEESPGLLPRLIETLMKQHPGKDIRMTAFEIYKDKFYSLMSCAQLFPIDKRGHGLKLPDNEVMEVLPSNYKDILRTYSDNRKEENTEANHCSSRSHALFRLEMHDPCMSVMIVDLAGSERVKKVLTDVNETKFINSSLLCLGNCLKAFKNGDLVPFRDSKLTKSLGKFINPRCTKIFVVSHINRSGSMFHQNSTILHYASMVCKTSVLNPDLNKSLIKTGRKPRMNETKTPARIERDKKKNDLISHFKRQWFESDHKGNEAEDKMAEAAQKQREKMYEAYLNQVIGQNKEYMYNLEEQFAKEDKQDDEWIRRLWQMEYKSPAEKRRTLREAGMKVMGSKSLRKNVLGMVEYKKECIMLDVATEMGESMRKVVEFSIKKEQQLEQEELKEMEELGIQVIPEELIPVLSETPVKSSHSQQFSEQKEGNKEEQLDEIEAQIWNSPEQISPQFKAIESSRKKVKEEEPVNTLSRMIMGPIRYLNERAPNLLMSATKEVMRSIKKAVCTPSKSQSMEETFQKASRFRILRQSGMNIHVQGELRQVQNQLKAVQLTEEELQEVKNREPVDKRFPKKYEEKLEVESVIQLNDEQAATEDRHRDDRSVQVEQPKQIEDSVKVPANHEVKKEESSSQKANEADEAKTSEKKEESSEESQVEKRAQEKNGMKVSISLQKSLKKGHSKSLSVTKPIKSSLHGKYVKYVGKSKRVNQDSATQRDLSPLQTRGQRRAVKPKTGR